MVGVMRSIVAVLTGGMGGEGCPSHREEAKGARQGTVNMLSKFI